MTKLDHLLSVGATGMLADTIVSLARRSHRLTSIARTEASLHALAQRIPTPNHTLLPIDYREGETFLARINSAIKASTPVDLPIVWMHGEERTSGVIDLARLLGEGEGVTDLYHVVGSSGRDLPALREGAREEFERVDGIAYHRVVLGYVEEASGRRWLRDGEISSGVVEAVESGSKVAVVGRVA